MGGNLVAFEELITWAFIEVYLWGVPLVCMISWPAVGKARMGPVLVYVMGGYFCGTGTWLLCTV